MTETTLKGIPASDGIAVGPLFCYIPVELTPPICVAGTVEEEMARFDAARALARVELQDLHDVIEKRAGKENVWRIDVS